MPSFSFSNSNKSIEDDSNESFFSVGDRLSMVPGTLDSRFNSFQGPNDSAYLTPKANRSTKIKEEITPNSDQENKPTNGVNKSLFSESNFRTLNDYSMCHSKGSRILSRASNFLKNERITDPIEHNASIASIQTNFYVNPMFPSDIMGTAFDKARADIDILLDDFKKNVSLIKERDNVPTSKWDLKKHTLSDEFLKLREKPKPKVASTSKNVITSADVTKTQSVVNSLLTTISQGANYQMTTNNPNYFPCSQAFLNNGVSVLHQQVLPPQNTFSQPLLHPQQGMTLVSSTPLQQPSMPTNDIGLEKTEEEIEAEEEKDRKIISILDRISRVEDPLP
uniref:Uncharacterized protein n=1 Tax=Strongyloides venezuelensis TaxID=75913 RepID=A0A0K0G159_STRVS